MIVLVLVVFDESYSTSHFELKPRLALIAFGWPSARRKLLSHLATESKEEGMENPALTDSKPL